MKSEHRLEIELGQDIPIHDERCLSGFIHEPQATHGTQGFIFSGERQTHTELLSLPKVLLDLFRVMMRRDLYFMDTGPL